jgi:hypothetical protein
MYVRRVPNTTWAVGSGARTPNRERSARIVAHFDAVNSPLRS